MALHSSYYVNLWDMPYTSILRSNTPNYGHSVIESGYTQARKVHISKHFVPQIQEGSQLSYMFLISVIAVG